MNFINSIKNNKTQFIFFIILIIYIILVSILFHYNPSDIINKYSSLSIATSLFGTFFIIMIMFFIKRRDELYGPQFNNQQKTDIPTIGRFLINFLYGLMIWVIPVIIIGVSYHYLKDASAITNSTILILNFFIFLLGLTLAYQFLKPRFEKNQTTQNKFMMLLTDIIFVIPCLITDFIEFLKFQYKITTHTEWIIFGIAILLILLRMIIPKILTKIIKKDGVNLLDYPINLNCENSLGTYEQFNKNKSKDNKNKFNYKYAISLWLYIDPQSPSTNSSYTENTNLLTYGGKPSILYNGLNNEIIITAKTGKEEKEIFKTKDIPYQKWTNFIINYQGGTLDIFIDNNLVSSTPNIVPYMSYDNIKTGKSNGIYGYIKDVVYFNDVLTRNKISWIYNS